MQSAPDNRIVVKCENELSSFYHFSAISKYAKDHNICVAKLSLEEKELLIQKFKNLDLN